MKHNVRNRGLAVVFVCLAVMGMTAATASASPTQAHPRPRVVLASGTWTDPGPTITSVTPQGSTYLVGLAGSTTTTGDMVGHSDYTFQVVFDPATNSLAGSGHERFDATIAAIGSGHLDIDEHIKVNGDGSEMVVGVIVGGDGAFRHAGGVLVFTGNTDDPSQPTAGTGPYWMAITLVP